MFATYSKLVRGFREAGVPLEFLPGTGSSQIFRMDISPRPRKGNG